MMRTIIPYRLTYCQLLADLHKAYYDARRHKRNKSYQQRFETNLENNLSALCYELWTRTYRPRPSTCFIITDPKRREVFAAEFRDRIVHHLYFNYVHEMLERTFIHLEDGHSRLFHEHQSAEAVGNLQSETKDNDEPSSTS